MPQQSHSMLKSKHLEHSSEEKEIELFSYIDLLNYMLKYKIPQIVTLTRLTAIFFARVGKMWGKFKQKKKLSIELSNT